MKRLEIHTYVCDNCGHRHSLRGGTEPDGTHIPAGECPIKKRRRSRTKQEWQDRIAQLRAQHRAVEQTNITSADEEKRKFLKEWKGEKPW